MPSISPQEHQPAIQIIRWDNIGNLLSTTPLISVLHKRQAKYGQVYLASDRNIDRQMKLARWQEVGSVIGFKPATGEPFAKKLAPVLAETKEGDKSCVS